MAYEVVTPVFEGPFDLLLHLILRDQVDVYQVSLSRIVDAYLAELDAQAQKVEGGPLDLDAATEFLLIAATLVELKTRRLLPRTSDPDADEELALLEERDLLLARLLECKTFRDAGHALSGTMRDAGRSWPRAAGIEDRFVDLQPDLLASVTAADLAAALVRAATPKPQPRIDLDHVAPIRISVADAVEELRAMLPERRRATFRELTDGLGGRLEIIVRFLACLQLFKDGLVELDQASTFAELVITWTGGEEGASQPDRAMAYAVDSGLGE